MSISFSFDAVTPSESIFSGMVTSLTLPGSMGIFQILVNHAPFMSSVSAGLVVITLQDSTQKEFKINSGFFEVSNNKAILLISEQITNA